MENVFIYVLYIAPLILIILIYSRHIQQHHAKSLRMKQEAISNGLAEPASLHPVIDPFKCIGCGSCVKACPEENVLGLIHQKAELIGPSHCIGHGACQKACPESAITLVFGTDTRGVDIPELSPQFETSVPGIYIAGELGGMGLIRNAIEQSCQAMKALQLKYLKSDQALNSQSTAECFDVIIIGAGPAGITAALYAKQQKLSYKVIEQDSLGGTVAHFPRGKIVMTAPAILPIVGKVKFTETTKEALIAFWEKIYAEQNLAIHFQEKMHAIEKEEQLFTIKTNKNCYQAKTVLLTIGRRGSPRTLDVPGEQLEKVCYRLIDPAQYQGQKVLVVGGGDSALEAALSISKEPGSEVILSYRGESFNRVKAKNRDAINDAVKAGNLKVLLASQVTEISQHEVNIQFDNQLQCFANDAVIICAGGILPSQLLMSMGITVTTKFGTA